MTQNRIISISYNCRIWKEIFVSASENEKQPKTSRKNIFRMSFQKSYSVLAAALFLLKNDSNLLKSEDMLN